MLPEDVSVPRPEGDGFFGLRVRGRDGAVCLFNMGRPARQLPEQCAAFALAVAHQLGTRGRFPPFPDTRLDIEDQDGNLLGYAVAQPWKEQPEFALYSPAGAPLITRPTAGGDRRESMRPRVRVRAVPMLGPVDAVKRLDPPPGFVILEVGKGCVLIIPEWVYVAGLRLGKTLRRQAARRQRDSGEYDTCRWGRLSIGES